LNNICFFGNIILSVCFRCHLILSQRCLDLFTTFSYTADRPYHLPELSQILFVGEALLDSNIAVNLTMTGLKLSRCISPCNSVSCCPLIRHIAYYHHKHQEIPHMYVVKKFILRMLWFYILMISENESKFDVDRYVLITFVSYFQIILLLMLTSCLLTVLKSNRYTNYFRVLLANLLGWIVQLPMLFLFPLELAFLIIMSIVHIGENMIA
jgi:hypothetical protein